MANARELGERYLRATQALWTRDADLTAELLTQTQPASRTLAAELTVRALATLPHQRQRLAATLPQPL